MAQWVNLTLAKLIPEPLLAIFDGVEALLVIVKTPLEAVATILNISKTVLAALAGFDPANILRGLVTDFKNNFLSSGYFLLDMWDYPNVQLKRATDIGPDAVYGTENLKGDKFDESFLADLIDSFSDVQDINRPLFTTDCGILVVLTAYPDLDMLDLEIGEANHAIDWPGFADRIRGAAEQINETRMQNVFARAVLAAELQITEDPQRTAARVDRLAHAFRLYSQMDSTTRAALPVPINPETGVSYYEDKTPANINWEQDILPLLDAIESFTATAKYPNWTHAALRDIYPDLANAISTILDAVVDLFPKGANIAEQIIVLIQAIEDKLNELRAIIDQIDQFVQNIEEIINTAGLYGIYITGNSISDLKTKLQSAAGAPAFEHGFYAGMAIVAGGPTFLPFKLLFSPIAAVTP